MLTSIGMKAKKAERFLMTASSSQKNKALSLISEALILNSDYIISENNIDIENARKLVEENKLNIENVETVLNKY